MVQFRKLTIIVSATMILTIFVTVACTQQPVEAVEIPVDEVQIPVEDEKESIQDGKEPVEESNEPVYYTGKPVETIFNFETGTQGWKGGFSDLPVNHEEIGYDLFFGYSHVPIEGVKSFGLMISGNNHSDDLFMFVTRLLDFRDGLTSNTAYTVQLSFDFATNIPPAMMGIGGSPGESVYIKAGVVNIEPKSIEDIADAGMYRMNIDIGSQSNSGNDMIVVGDAAKVEGSGQYDESFQYKHFGQEFQVVTSKNGELWVIIGTDSGFEGISEFYIDNISISLTAPANQ
ncbi:hypothetical protein ACFLXY_10625 [Chloroflexota bacterium]